MKKKLKEELTRRAEVYERKMKFKLNYTGQKMQDDDLQRAYLKGASDALQLVKQDEKNYKSNDTNKRR